MNGSLRVAITSRGSCALGYARGLVAQRRHVLAISPTLGRTSVATLVCALAAGACGQPFDDSSLDASWIDVPPPPFAPLSDESVDRMIDVFAVSASLGWGFGDELDAMNRLPGTTPMDRRAAIERGLATQHFVRAPGCATLTWDGEVGTLVMETCTLSVSGRPLEGTWTLDIGAAPDLRISLTESSVRAHHLEGQLVLRPGSRDFAGIERHVEGEVRYPDTGGQASLTVRARVGLRPVVSGVMIEPVVDARWNSPFRAAELLADLRWRAADCLPSDGFLWLRDHVAETEAEFSETTPADGRWGPYQLSCR